MIDSTNPRQLADNIRKLWDKFKSISGDLLPSRSTATAGQILKLTGENKTPTWSDEIDPHFSYSSTQETDSGFTYNGKTVYVKVFTGPFPTIEAASNVTIEYIEGLTIVMCRFILYTATAAYCNQTNGVTYAQNGTITIGSVSPAFSNMPYCLILWYTKPDPAPETRDDDTPEEVKETKTRKKTTK